MGSIPLSQCVELAGATMVTGQRYIVAFSPSQIRYQKPGPAPTIPTSTALKVQAHIKGWEPAF